MQRKNLVLLLKRQWFENCKAWLIGTGCIIAILCLLFLVIWRWRTSFNGDSTRGIFLILLFGGGSIFSFTFFKDLGDKQKGIWFIVLPATAAEKLLVMLFYSIIGYLVAYLFIFYAANTLFISFIGEEGVGFGKIDLLKNNFYYCIYAFVVLQSIMLLGSVYFTKYPFAKTILAIIVMMFLVFNLNTLLLKVLTNEISIESSIPFDSFQFAYGGESVYVSTPSHMQLATSILLWVIVPISLWSITWLRIKEKEL